MANPSTVWTQLSLPNPPAGSIPFVDTDDATIITDVLNFYYDPDSYRLTAAGGLKLGYSDSSATPGAATINKAAGRSAFAAAASSVVITNNLVAVGDIVQTQLETADATLTRVISVAAAGSFTVTGNAVATGITKFSWVLLKVSSGLPA